MVQPDKTEEELLKECLNTFVLWQQHSGYKEFIKCEYEFTRLREELQAHFDKKNKPSVVEWW